METQGTLSEVIRRIKDSGHDDLAEEMMTYARGGTLYMQVSGHVLWKESGVWWYKSEN
jgi:hypothetical protein